MGQSRERRSTPLHIEGIPGSADEWITLYRKHHRLYGPTEVALRQLHSALQRNPKPRPSGRAVARECGVQHATMARLLDELVELGAARESPNGYPMLTLMWPPA